MAFLNSRTSISILDALHAKFVEFIAHFLLFESSMNSPDSSRIALMFWIF
jgi:hypothetical protein